MYVFELLIFIHAIDNIVVQWMRKYRQLPLNFGNPFYITKINWKYFERLYRYTNNQDIL